MLRARKRKRAARREEVGVALSRRVERGSARAEKHVFSKQSQFCRTVSRSFWYGRRLRRPLSKVDRRRATQASPLRKLAMAHSGTFEEVEYAKRTQVNLENFPAPSADRPR